MDRLNQLDLRSRIISVSKQSKTPKKTNKPRLEFSRMGNHKQQLVEEIDTDYDEREGSEVHKSPSRTSTMNDSTINLNRNSPSSTQFIQLSPQNSASAQRSSINNHNFQNQQEEVNSADENVVDMIKMVMLQLNTMSSRMDSIEQRLENNSKVPDKSLRGSAIKQVQPVFNQVFPNRPSNKVQEVLKEKDPRQKLSHAGKNINTYSSNTLFDDEDDGWGSEDDSYGSGSSDSDARNRIKDYKTVSLDKFQLAWNWWLSNGVNLWIDFMDLSVNIDDFNYICQYAKISDQELGGVPFLLPNGTVMMLRTKGKSALKLSKVLTPLCSFMGADPYLQKSGAMLNNDFFPSKISDFSGFLDELRTIVMYMVKHSLNLFGTRIIQVSDISLINEFLSKIQAKASSVVNPNGKNRVTNYAAFFMIFWKMWNNAFIKEDLSLLVDSNALAFLNNQCNSFIGMGAVHPALAISKVILFFGWVCQSCGLLGVCNLYCSNCHAKVDKSKDDKMTLEKAYASQELMIGTNMRDYNAFYSRSGISV